jgi:hypothetical protein
MPNLQLKHLASSNPKGIDFGTNTVNNQIILEGSSNSWRITHGDNKNNILTIIRYLLLLLILCFSNVSNSFALSEDAQKELERKEEILLKKYPQYVEKIGGDFTIKLKNGKEVRLEECIKERVGIKTIEFLGKKIDCYSNGLSNHKFLKIIKDQYILIRGQYWEGYAFQLINLDNGETINILEEPHFSPDGKKFLTVCRDSDLFIIFSSLHTRLYSLINNEFKLEFSIKCYDEDLNFPRHKMILTDIINWENNNKVKIKMTKNLTGNNIIQRYSIIYNLNLNKWELNKLSIIK